ncbi:MAG: hypothetical protein PHN78_06535 [Dehalococcoidales bacterium]|nr:hypothetical protein [Dehalococcoidales bacterium]
MNVIRPIVVIVILLLLFPLLILDVFATSTDDVPLYRVWAQALCTSTSLVLHPRKSQQS